MVLGLWTYPKEARNVEAKFADGSWRQWILILIRSDHVGDPILDNWSCGIGLWNCLMNGISEVGQSLIRLDLSRSWSGSDVNIPTLFQLFIKLVETRSPDHLESPDQISLSRTKSYRLKYIYSINSNVRHLRALLS